MQQEAAAARRLSVALLLAALGCAPAAPAPAAAVDIAPAQGPSSTPARRRPLDGRIREASVGVYEIDAPLFEQLVDDPEAALSSLRFEPVEQDGKVVGHRVQGVRPGSLPARLGLIDDDLIEVVNGEGLRSPASVEAARATARRTGQVTVVLDRNGFLKLLVYRLVYFLSAPCALRRPPSR